MTPIWLEITQAERERTTRKDPRRVRVFGKLRACVPVTQPRKGRKSCTFRETDELQRQAGLGSPVRKRNLYQIFASRPSSWFSFIINSIRLWMEEWLTGGIFNLLRRKRRLVAPTVVAVLTGKMLRIYPFLAKFDALAIRLRLPI
jgi:hypothetical protein